VIWGAGKKKKKNSPVNLLKKGAFDWVCDNSKKIESIFYDVKMQSSQNATAYSYRKY